MYLVVDVVDVHCTLCVHCKTDSASHTDMDMDEILCLTVEDTQLMPIAQTACEPGLTLILPPLHYVAMLASVFSKSQSR